MLTKIHFLWLETNDTDLDLESPEHIFYHLHLHGLYNYWMMNEVSSRNFAVGPTRSL